MVIHHARRRWPPETGAIFALGRHGIMRRNGHNLVELVVALAIIGVLTCIAVPRLPLGAVRRARVETAARRVMMDLQLARSRAILQATQSPAGCALTMTGSPPYQAYQLVDLGDARVIASHDLPSGVRCTGGSRFEFDPLGRLKAGSDTQLNVTAEGRMRTITVVPATGMVKCL
jgi:prepilin-type N-terminal cleavage/methylation domain-containing protein